MRDFEYQMIPETQGQPSEATPPAEEINRFAEMNPLCSEYNVFAEDQRAAEFGREQQPSRSSQSSAGRA